MIVYISGPITGVFDYRENFARAEKLLAAQGHIVLNPSKINSGMKFEQYLAIDLQMLEQAECIYLLPGYEKSVECSVEILHVFVRRFLGIKQGDFKFDENALAMGELSENAYSVLTGEKIDSKQPLTFSYIHAIRKVFPQYIPYGFECYGGIKRVNMAFEKLNLNGLSDGDFLDRIEELSKPQKEKKPVQVRREEWNPQVGDSAWHYNKLENRIYHVNICGMSDELGKIDLWAVGIGHYQSGF